MKKTGKAVTAVLFSLILVSAVSCQKSSTGKLKSCLKECNKQFEKANADCTVLKNEMKKAECHTRASTESAACMQKCNE